YNGGSVGGVIFSPAWVAAISVLGFVPAAIAISCIAVVILWILSGRLLSRTPHDMGLMPDGAGRQEIADPWPGATPRPGRKLWRDVKFLSLATGMTIGLFAQIGLLAHLFSFLAPALGTQRAGLAMGLATGAAIAGRTIVGWTMPLGADRRLAACA